MKNIHLDITMNPGADRMSALSETLVIAKACKATMSIKMNGYNIHVSPESYLTDLYEISTLKEKALK